MKEQMKKQMLEYLQYLMDGFKMAEAKYGINDEGVLSRLDEMIACKNMVESIICEPVNLGLNGIVTIGF